MTFVVMAGLCLRLYMVVFHAHEVGFSLTSYVAPCYLLAAGYGYKRPCGGRWEHDREFASKLRAQSLALARTGARFDAQHKPAVDPQQLRPLHYRAPGYAAFLYLLYRTYGEPLGACAVVVQALLASFYPVVVYFLLLKTFPYPGVALASAWLTALHPPLALISAGVLPDSLAMGFLLLAVLCFVHAANKPSYLWMLMTGILLAASCYFRTNAMLLWVFLGVALLVKGRGWFRPVLSTAIVAAGLYGGMLPWALWNYRVSGYWIWGSTAVGRSLAYFVGMYPNTLGLKDDDAFIMAYAQAHGFESDATPEADAWFRKSIRQFYCQNPGLFVKATLKNLPWALAPPFQTGLVSLAGDRFKNTFTYYKHEEGLSPIQVVIRHPRHVLLNYGERVLVMIVSAAGNLSLMLLLLRRWRQRGDVLLLIALPLYYLAVHSTLGFIHSMPRYLAPMIPFQMIGLVLAVKETRAWWAGRRAPRV